MDKTSKFLVFKLNINENIFTSDNTISEIKKQEIPNTILSFSSIGSNDDPFLKVRSSKYTLANVEKLDENVIIGDIFRIKEMKTEKYKVGKTETAMQDEGETYPFVYCIEEEFLFLKNQSNPKTVSLSNYFGMILSNKNQRIGELEIKPKCDIDNINQIISDENNRIIKFEFKYIAPNDKVTIDDMGKVIDQFQGRKGKFEIDNNAGLKLKDENNKPLGIVNTSNRYSEQGYGSTKIEYIDINGNKKDANSDSYIKSVDLPEDKNSKKILEKIYNFLNIGDNKNG